MNAQLESEIQKREAIAHFAGGICKEVEFFARATGISEEEIASRLGTILLGLQGGMGMGRENPLRDLRRAAGSGSTDIRIRTLALARFTRDSRTQQNDEETDGDRGPAVGSKGPHRRLSAAARKRISEAQKLRWARQKGTKVSSGPGSKMGKWWREHFPTPEARQKEMLRRMAKR